jgi:hypothetical protein
MRSRPLLAWAKPRCIEDEYPYTQSLRILRSRAPFYYYLCLEECVGGEKGKLVICVFSKKEGGILGKGELGKGKGATPVPLLVTICVQPVVGRLQENRLKPGFVEKGNWGKGRGKRQREI